MPKSHKVQTGDTLIKLAIQYYGKPSRYTDIFKANPIIKNPDLIYPGQVLTIPDVVDAVKPKESTDIPVTEMPEAENNDEPILSEEVSLVVDGVIFKFWEGIDISLPFDSIRTFSLSAPFQSDNETYREIFRPFKYKSCILYVGGKKIITGTIISVKTKSNENSNTVTVEGYSRPGVLNDVNPSPNAWPLSFNGLDLKQIAEKLCAPFGVPILFDVDPGAVFKNSDKIEFDPDKTVFDGLIDLAKQRGIIVGDDANGNLVFRKATEEKASFSIAYGKFPYRSSDFNYDGQKRYSDITIINDNKKSGAGSRFTIADNELKNNGINRTLTYKSKDCQNGQIKNAAQAKLGRTLAESISGTIDLIGWRNPNKQFLNPNQRFNYTSEPDMFYYSTELLIKEVKFKKTQTEITSTISVVLPDSYGESQPESMPWQS